MEHNYEWFSKYIWGEEVPPSSTPPASGGQQQVAHALAPNPNP